MADFPTYDIGTISIANNGTVATGNGTHWTRSRLRKGDDILIDPDAGHPITIVLDVIDDGTIKLPKWVHGTKVNVPYIAFKRSTDRYTGDVGFDDIDGVVTALNHSGYVVTVPDSETEPSKAEGRENQRARQYATGKEWQKKEGVWILQGTFGPFLPPVLWSGATNYPIRALVKRAGKIWESKQSDNLNHPPESSPAWWDVFLENGDVYDLLHFDTDRPADGELVQMVRVARPTVILAGMSDSIGFALVGATNDAVFSFRRCAAASLDTEVEFATATFPAGGSREPVFNCPADRALTRGDLVKVYAPQVRDLTLRTIALTTVAYR
jgi:hypothetical protein